MCVTFDHDSGASFVCVFLVRNTKLVMSNDLVVGYFLPFGASDEVLCLQGGIPQHVRIASHFNEFFCWHFLPEFVQEGPIVDSKGGSDTFGQSVPIFGIVAVGPFVDCSHAALHFCETMKLWSVLESFRRSLCTKDTMYVCEKSCLECPKQICSHQKTVYTDCAQSQ